MLVAFKAVPRAYGDSNAYITTEQGKPLDFLLEIASAALPVTTPAASACGTLDWGSRNTGGSTRRTTTTAPSCLATGWWKAGTGP